MTKSLTLQLAFLTFGPDGLCPSDTRTWSAVQGLRLDRVVVCMCLLFMGMQLIQALRNAMEALPLTILYSG